MLNANYLANPRMTGENRLPARTLLIPAEKRGITHKNFTESDRITLLNGVWKFSYLSEDTTEAFYLPSVEDSAWDDLPVPSMWQYLGYGSCYYPNVRYCFPYDPPYIHRDNPVGLYRTVFNTCKHPGERSILRFGGVDNAYFVWLNGEYVGFSKGSRLAAEFDVTDKLLDGDNLLAVKVYTFSDASYLENQDMLMASGIFRDVMLLRTPQSALWDYTVLPDRNGFGVQYTCTMGDAPARLRFTLCDAEGDQQAQCEVDMTEQGEIFLPLEQVREWNAEAPYLYSLYIEVFENGQMTESHTKKVGLAISEIRPPYLTMNQKPIVLKGVNRHDNNPHCGRAITAAQIERELLDIKGNGLNAIRCSHYTNQPIFYELASELGIYVMDEADLESHGAEATGDRGVMNKDPEWYDAFFDRVSRMYALNKNEACVNIWSLGNEYGAGDNEQKCAEWLAAQPVKKPIRGDGNPVTDRGAFHLTGYMPLQVLVNTEAESKGPLIMVEYAHAMGNSPGGIEEIWNWVYQHDHCCGGYVWEYKNHGFYAEGKDGRARYLYGGDFKDVAHWSNFSLDGFHISDGTPKPVWLELGEIFAPIFVRWEEDGACIKNTGDFVTLENVVLRWLVKADGVAVRSGEITLDPLPARGWQKVALPLDTAGLVGCITADCEFYRNGEKIAHKQKLLADIPAPAESPMDFAHTVTVDPADPHHVTVTGDGFALEIRKGMLAGMTKNGRVVLDAPMAINCWRAYIDNENGGFGSEVVHSMEDRLVSSMSFGCHALEVADTPSCVTLKANGKFLPYCHNWGFHTQITYRVTAGGVVDVAVSLEPYGDDPPKLLNRVGVKFELPAAYTHCAWLGCGPGDSYPDRKANAPIGLYEADVDSMNFLYDVPQETGNRHGCRRLTVSGGDADLRVEGQFSFSLHNFTQWNLYKARHRDELELCEEKYLYIDHLQRGLGSKSCGPGPEAAYEIPMGKFSWSFRMFWI